MIYIDSNIFIFAGEGVAETAAPSRKLIEFLRERRGMGVTSELTPAEVLAPPQRKGALPLSTKKRVYLDLLLWSRSFDLVPVSLDISTETAKLRKVARPKLPDAIHPVSAIRRDCRFLVCDDNDFKKLPANMKRVRPTLDEIESLIRRAR